jgi:uncharacterized protein involved in exopolysaccharide biosynthesis
MAWERAADGRGPPASNGGLDAELEKAVTSGEALAYVVLYSGDRPGQIFALKRSIVVLGRADDADVHIVDTSVSSHHARILNRSQGFEIVDLESTNGTFVGGKRVTRSALRNGDRVTLGTVELMFLLDRPTNATIKLPDAFSRAPVAATSSALVTTRPSTMAPRLAVALPARHEEEEVSFADIVRKAARAYHFIREHALLIAAFAAVGVAFGVFSILVAPPGVTAFSEVRLLPHMTLTSTRDEDRWENNDQDSGLFVKGAERALTQPELVRTTLRKLGSPDPADAWIHNLISKLKVEETGDHVFRASYKDSASARPTPVDFLGVHLQNYVQSEIAKSLRELSAKVDFLRGELKSAEKDLDSISGERAGFREANADRLPEDSEQTHSSRFELQTRRAELSAQIHQLQGELNAALGQLKTNRPEAQRKFQYSEQYRQRLTEINSKLSEAYARGLKDGHPEVQQLQEEKQNLEAMAKNELQAPPSSVLTRESDPLFLQTQAQVEKLQAELSAARASLAETEGSLGEVRRVVQDLPRVEQRLADLEHRQDATKQLHSQLFASLKQAEIQLNLEKVSAESRYDVSPPKLDRSRKLKTLLIRGSLGLLAGILAVAIMILLREGRRIVAQTLASPTLISRVVSPRDRSRDRF